MHELLFHYQSKLENDDLRGYASRLVLDVARFDTDRTADVVGARIARDVRSAIATGRVTGTPTLFIDGVLHTGPYDEATLVEELRES